MKLISRAAGVAAATLVAGTLAAVAPAHAASGDLTYTCGVPLFGSVTNFDFATTMDTNLPDTVQAGQSVPMEISATASVPAELSELAYGFLQARSADGTGTVKMDVNGTVTDALPATIAKTAIPETGALPLPISSAGTFAPTAAGTHVIKAGDFTAAIKFYNEADEEVFAVEASCTPKTVNDNGTPDDPSDDTPFEQDLTVDTVTVTPAPVVQPPVVQPPVVQPPVVEPPVVEKASTKTLVKGKYIKKKKMIRANITVRGGETKASGKVRVVVKKGKKTVKKLTVKLNKKGKAVAKIKKIKAKGKYKVTATYLGDDTHKRSKKKIVVKVS